MSVIFSRQCEYALQAILYLAMKQDGQATSIRELTAELNTPYYFLAKILQDLAHRGLLKSYKGLGGGFVLARSSHEITLIEVIEAIDGNGFMQQCVLGFPECSKTSPCALHDQWGKTRDEMFNVLNLKTVAELAGSMKKKEYTKIREKAGKRISEKIL